MLWITKSHIAKHRDISRNVRDDKINPIIEEVQFLDIRKLLGDDLYFALDNENTLTSKSDRFKKLMNAGSYENNGKTYYNAGLEKVLSIYAYAKYVLIGSFTDTAFGFVQKKTQDSESVGDAQKRNVHKMELQTAADYFVSVSEFLDRNVDIYPEWKTSGCRTSGSIGKIRISKIK